MLLAMRVRVEVCYCKARMARKSKNIKV